MNDVMVSNLAEAVRALRAADRGGSALTLHSPPFAALSLGPGYFREMIGEARRLVPGVACLAILDCGDTPGLALAALAAGVEAVRISAPAAVIVRLRAIAEQHGAQLFSGWPDGLPEADRAVTELP